jgi:hypothetical protein
MYGFIDRMRSEYPVEMLCRMLGVSRSSYYGWKNGSTYQINYQKGMMEQRGIAVFGENKRRYGSRRVAAAVHNSTFL